MKTYDLIVIGAGRASTLAIEAGNAGQKVALIEREALGGTCPNRGCVPSKLLIGYAAAAQQVKDAQRHHIDASFNSVNLAKISEDLREWRAGVDPRYVSRLPDTVDLIRGHACFLENKVIEVNEEKYTADKIVIATGSRSRPAEFDHPRVWTSDQFFDFSRPLPASIAIVGGGFIACELAHFFHGVGIKTTLIVRRDVLLPNEDEDISEIFASQFTEHVTTKFNTTISEIRDAENGVSLILDSEDTPLHVEAVLYATGRIFNTDSLNLEQTDVATGKRGEIINNEQLESSVPGVFVAGDIAGKYQLQHAASFDVQYLIKKIVHGETNSIHYPLMPHAVFSEPEIASVGPTEQELKKQDRLDDLIIIAEGWNASVRAMSWKIDFPRTKLIVKKSDYSIIACHMIGPHASTLIHQVLMLIHLDNDIRKLAEMIHIHPALSEAVQDVAKKAISAIDDN